jgi:site-specific recombinase XerD
MSYRTTINLLINFLRIIKKISLSNISFSLFNRELIIEYLDWLEINRNNSKNSRNQRLAALRSFFKYAGYIDCSLISLHLEVQQIPIKKVQGQIVDFISENALKTIFEQPNLKKHNGVRDQFFMILMYDTAARCGELLKMRVCDIRYDIKDPVVYLDGKGKKPRIVPIMNKTVEHCKRYMNIFHNIPSNDDYLFYTIIHGIRQQMSADIVAIFMKKYAKSASISCSEVPENLHPHQFRHSRAIHYYRNGMPLNLLAEYLGHTSVDTTKIYAYSDTEMKRCAMEKANINGSPTPEIIPIWENDEDMILKLSGLR